MIGLNDEKETYVQALGSLIGRLPASDKFQWARNEGTQPGSEKAVVCACFVESGDLRSVIESVLSIPLDYKGKLTLYICEADAQKCVSAFSIFCLMETMGPRFVDVILHLMYSQRLTQWMSIVVMAGLLNYFMEFQDERILNSRLNAAFTQETKNSVCASLQALGKHSDMLTPTALRQVEMVRPKRQRVAERLQWLRKDKVVDGQCRWRGVLVPFGTRTDGFIIPNPMFAAVPGCPFGSRMVPDPVTMFDMDEVLRTRRPTPHVARNDIYGALYHHVRQQLLDFMERLRRFRADIHVRHESAKAFLATARGRRLAFDRIDICGVTRHLREDVAARSGPANVAEAVLITQYRALLRPTRFATMVALYTDWRGNADALLGIGSLFAIDYMPSVGQFVLKAVRQHVNKPTEPRRSARRKRVSNIGVTKDFHALEVMREKHLTRRSLKSLYSDTSVEFRAFLVARYGERFVRTCRKAHLVVPPRLFVPVDAPHNARPHVHHYHLICLGAARFSERYVEWGSSK